MAKFVAVIIELFTDSIIFCFSSTRVLMIVFSISARKFLSVSFIFSYRVFLVMKTVCLNHVLNRLFESPLLSERFDYFFY